MTTSVSRLWPNVNHATAVASALAIAPATYGPSFGGADGGSALAEGGRGSSSFPEMTYTSMSPLVRTISLRNDGLTRSRHAAWVGLPTTSFVTLCACA